MSEWKLDSEKLDHVIWNDIGNECVTCYSVPEDTEEAGCLRGNNPALAKMVLALLNGDLAAACGMTEEQMAANVYYMVIQEGCVVPDPCLIEVIKAISKLIREAK